MAETADYGIVRLVVGRPETAREALEKAGFSIGLTDVVCVNMPDQPGSLYQILKILTEANINIDYMYAFSNRDVALAVIRAADIEQVINVLHSNSLTLLSQSDIYQL